MYVKGNKTNSNIPELCCLFVGHPQSTLWKICKFNGCDTNILITYSYKWLSFWLLAVLAFFFKGCKTIVKFYISLLMSRAVVFFVIIKDLWFRNLTLKNPEVAEKNSLNICDILLENLVLMLRWILWQWPTILPSSTVSDWFKTWSYHARIGLIVNHMILRFE